MGIDRFVYWNKRRPTKLEIQQVLEDYLGTVLTNIYVEGPRITVLLQGKPRFPFRRIAEMASYTEAQEQHDRRAIEVYWTNKSIDVITRMTDEFTNVVAEGFAALAARFWEGKREASD